MENQDKILSILTKMQTQMNHITSDIGTLKSDFSDLKSDVAILKSDVKDLKSDVTDLAENQISLASIIDNHHKSLFPKVNQIVEDLEFLTHKEFENEKAVYKINKKLEVIK